MKLASLILNADDSWSYSIDGKEYDWTMAENEKDAREELKCHLEEHFNDEINYYTELKESLVELN